MSRSEVLLRDKNVLAGLIFILIAAVFGYAAYRLPFGTTLRMGPGYFPLVLSGLLAFFGLITLATGIRTASTASSVAGFVWGRAVLICGAALFFAVCLDGIGMPLSVFGTVLIAAMASRRFRLLEGVLLGLGVSAGAWVLFAMLLNLPFRMFGSWLG